MEDCNKILITSKYCEGGDLDSNTRENMNIVDLLKDYLSGERRICE